VSDDVLEVPLRFPRGWFPRHLLGLASWVTALVLTAGRVVGHVEGRHFERSGILPLQILLVCLYGLGWWGTRRGAQFRKAEPSWRIRLDRDRVIVQRGLPPELVPIELRWSDCELVYMADVEHPKGGRFVTMGFKPYGTVQPLLWLMSRRHGSEMLPVRDWILNHRPDVPMTDGLRQAHRIDGR
jgi:hypothetical protein